MSTARFKTVATLAVALAAAALGGCNLEPSAADKPTYEADVRPIFMSRCIRCHGSPPLTDPTDLPLPILPPATIRFDVFGDTNCGADSGAMCVHGAAYEATNSRFSAVLDLDQKAGGMPPAPAPALTSYQHDTILKWEAEAKNGGTLLEK